MTTPSPSTASPPRWARSLDVLCLVLVAVALVVAEWGGFRVRIAGTRVALTSPYRLLGLAALVAIGRHVLSPAIPIYRDLPARAAAWWRMPPARMAWLATVATRLPMLFVGYFAVLTLGYNGGQPPLRYADNELLNLQGRWDATWYMQIAIDGYRYHPAGETEQQNIVFFPALPAAARIAGRLFGGTSIAFLLATTLLLLGAFFWALIYLHRLARDLLGGDDPARWAVWLLAAYPFALFYSAVYTESLFLLGTTGAFYHYRRAEWVKAAAWGLLVGLTRPNGCFLSIPLALIAIRPWVPRWLEGGDAADGDTGKVRTTSFIRGIPGIPALAAAAAPGLGVLAYSAFIWRLTGDPLAWAEGHSAWGRQYSGLLPLAERYYGYLAESGVYTVTKVLPFDTLNALGCLFVLTAVVPVWRRFGLPFAVFILINILPPLAAGGFLSTGRLSAVLFPAFIWLAAVVPERHRPAWLASFMAVQALNAAMFYTWHEMF